jgi:hypothetical protein
LGWFFNSLFLQNVFLPFDLTKIKREWSTITWQTAVERAQLAHNDMRVEGKIPVSGLV